MCCGLKPLKCEAWLQGFPQWLFCGAELWYTARVMGRRSLLPLTAILLATALYLLTLTNVHTFDALSYILDVDRKPWPELFHPHHLAYGPLGAVIRGLAMRLGWAGSAERLLQVTNALAGGLGVGLFAALLGRVTGRLAPAALGALLLGVSYAYWYYAVEVEVYTIAALFLIAGLALMLALARRPTVALAAAMGLVQGGAVLFHQTNVLLSVPALVALGVGLSGRDEAAPLPRRGRQALALLGAYAAPLALIVAGAYLGVGLGLSGLGSWADLARWATGYTTTGYWGGAVDGAKLALLGKGLAMSLAQPGGAVIGLGLLAVLLLNVRRLSGAPRGTVALALSWLAVYGAFFLWWEPDNIEFWIASLPPFYLLVILAACPPTTGQARAWARLWPLLLLGLGLAMLGLNVVTISRHGDAGRDLQRVTAAALAEHSTAGDLLIVPDGVLELYLPFYVGRPQVISLNQAMTATGDWGAACQWLHARIDEALGSGYGVLIAAEAMRPVPAPPGEPPTPVERLGLDATTVAACYAPLEPALEPLPLAAGLPGYYHIPAAQALADGPGWDFTRGQWGWRAINAAPVQSALAGWALRPEIDPALISPPLSLTTGRYRAVELRLASDTAVRDAQLFFLDASGQTDERRSLRWTLAPGPEAHTYRLDLADAPGWTGVVTGLRLDPVGVGDGGTVVVEWLRLLP